MTFLFPVMLHGRFTLCDIFLLALQETHLIDFCSAQCATRVDPGKSCLFVGGKCAGRRFIIELQACLSSRLGGE